MALGGRKQTECALIYSRRQLAWPRRNDTHTPTHRMQTATSNTQTGDSLKKELGKSNSERADRLITAHSRRIHRLESDEQTDSGSEMWAPRRTEIKGASTFAYDDSLATLCSPPSAPLISSSTAQNGKAPAANVYPAALCYPGHDHGRWRKPQCGEQAIRLQRRA